MEGAAKGVKMNELKNVHTDPFATTLALQYVRKDWEETAINAYDLFQVDGVVYFEIAAVVTTAPTSSGTPALRLGVTGNTDALIGDTNIANLAAGNIWALTSASNADGSTTRIVGYAADTNITVSITGTVLTAGAFSFHLSWRRVTPEASVIAV